uniref:50S ribosomal protein L35 n=1 Tax=Chloropicon laureae TaxID=464258 RepID=A0A7S2Z2L0_9CHLO|mmetsp:Transcript_2676/g.6751  ORF Transcript_2676/g.6751 Transcript_2676/m.6751 type:complete len:208 (+) Transcript_2676:49-672(+)
MAFARCTGRLLAWASSRGAALCRNHRDSLNPIALRPQRLQQLHTVAGIGGEGSLSLRHARSVLPGIARQAIQEQKRWAGPLGGFLARGDATYSSAATAEGVRLGVGQQQQQRQSLASPLRQSHFQPHCLAVQVREMGGKKLKSYSSYKRRFKLSASGKYARARCGNAHMAQSKSKTRKRRLRQNTTTHEGYAKVMRKLGFKKPKYNM